MSMPRTTQQKAEDFRALHEGEPFVIPNPWDVGSAGFPFTLTARAENHVRGNPDLEDTIARLTAYAEAGADVLYAPGLRTLEEIRSVCEAVSLPVNVLAVPDLSLAQISAA